MTLKEERSRANISIDQRIRAMGEELARMDHRDFSNEVEWLIESEHKRRNFQVAAPAGAENGGQE
jgi:hypothetical protein